MRFLRFPLLLSGILSVAIMSAGFAFGEPVRFDRDIRPILSDKCFFCHGPDHEHREADLRLDLEDAAKDHAIVPGDAEASVLVNRIVSESADEMMPPPEANKPLTPGEIDLLKRWINEGATWTQHWAFLPLIPVDRPVVSDTHWTRGAIDEFVLQRLEREGLKPNDPASKEKWIRRLSFDLTGLPPTLQQVDAFVNDKSADAYEKLVDRLLQSQHYGERMALMWMDAARYGDTSVYHADGPRDMWAWRDAIVDAYNRNLPFDQFSINQLAGDLIPDASIEQQILAGFNRNNGTTDEGGAIAEEYRVEYAVDRVKTTSTVWLGLTMECGQCHDHKYDPISQEDYYRFFAFFNVSKDGGMQTRNGNAAPTLAVPDPAKQARLPMVQQQLAETKQNMESRRLAAEPDFVAWIKEQETRLAAKETTTTTGALMHLGFSEGSGAAVADAVDAARVGTIQGKASWVKTRFDWGLDFDGSNFVDLGDVGDFERTDSFSIAGWIKPKKNATGAMLARMDDANQHRGYDVYVGDSPVSMHIINVWPANAIKVTTKKKMQPDKWQHVAATYDGSSKAEGIKIYVDGELWDWKIEQNGLSDTIRTEKTLLVGSRHPGSRFRGTIDDVQLFGRALNQAEVSEIKKESGINMLLALGAEQRSDQQVESLREHFLASVDSTYRDLKAELESLAAEETELQKPLTTVMVMGDLEQPRETFVLHRGAYDSPSETKVEPGTLAILPPMKSDSPRNRLGLATWLFQDDHPLTARVAVNRYWQMFFGTGLVATPEDFGSQGDFPSHPELLDWLAIDFRENGWNVKRLVKQIVMSSTYRQSSLADPQSYARDPANRLLARGPRFRLQGEFIRDNALALSGLLVNEIGGPGVKPYQPAGLWAEVGLGGNPRFVQDHGDKLYRRSLYTYWKRSAPPPAMQIFDAPTREKCTIRRARTNTPLQALATLNDVQFVEASRHFSQRILCEGGSDIDSRITFAFRLATARSPTASEKAILADVYQAALDRYAGDQDAANKLLAVGESDRDSSLDATQHAAWTILGSAILNLDETLTRE